MVVPLNIVPWGAMHRPSGQIIGEQVVEHSVAHAGVLNSRAWPVAVRISKWVGDEQALV
jgi:hypothetical protein